MLSTWRNMGPLKRREALEGYLCLVPWIVGFAFFTIIPVGATLYYSFTQWNIVEPPIWIGLKNYDRMFNNDPLFWKSLRVTGGYVLFSLPLKLILGLALALLLNLKLRGMNFYRTVFYIPAVISGVAVSLMFMWLLNPDTGIINSMLDDIGIEGPRWFWDLDWALPSVALMSVWKVGGSAIIYLAGLQNVPTPLPSRQNRWGRHMAALLRITLPLITPTIFFQLIIEMIDSFKVFTEAFVITQGGPVKATYFFLYYFYEEAFQDFNAGYASGLAMVLMAIILATTVVLNVTSSRWVYYELD